MTIDIIPFNPSRCNIAGDKRCGVCLEITALDALIERLVHRQGLGPASDNVTVGPNHDPLIHHPGSAELERLVHERNTTLKDRVNPAHDPIVRRLPVELISRIFIFCNNDYQPLGSSGQDDQSHSPKPSSSSPLVISAVCRSWRIIAFSTPSLWTTLKIDIHSFEDLLLQQEFAQQWLARSGQLPLNISVNQVNSFNCESEIPKSSVIDTVRRFALRWRVLKLHLSASLCSPFFVDLECLPILQSLHLRYHTSRSGPVRLPRTPALQYFWTNLLSSLVNLPDLSGLRTCHLIYPGVNDALDFLLSAKNIRKCSLWLGSPQAHHVQSGELITLPHLRELEIKPSMTAPQSSASTIFGRLRTPSLDRFAYNLNPFAVRTPPGVLYTADLVSFLRSTQSLRVLELEWHYPPGLTEQGFVDILESVPRLSWLSLKCCNMQPIKWLTNHIRGNLGSHNQPICDLQRLDLQISTSQPFSWETFLLLLQEICRPVLDAQLASHNGISVGQNVRSGTTRRQIDVRLILPHASKGSDRFAPYIPPNISSRLRNPDWNEFISLTILDAARGGDLIAESLA